MRIAPQGTALHRVAPSGEDQIVAIQVEPDGRDVGAAVPADGRHAGCPHGATEKGTPLVRGHRRHGRSFATGSPPHGATTSGYHEVLDAEHLAGVGPDMLHVEAG